MEGVHPKDEKVIHSIDETLSAPPISIEEALRYAVDHGVLSIKDAEECREAYYQTLNRLKDVLGEDTQ